MQDEEIAYAVAQNPNVRLAAAEIADRIAMKFARQATVRVGDTSVEYGKRAQDYRLMAVALRAESALRGAVPYMGGISIDDKAVRVADSDAVQPAFARTLFDDVSPL